MKQEKTTHIILFKAYALKNDILPTVKMSSRKKIFQEFLDKNKIFEFHGVKIFLLAIEIRIGYGLDDLMISITATFLPFHFILIQITTFFYVGNSIINENFFTFLISKLCSILLSKYI